ncbi:MAG: hypothetical protein PsegKO_27980 [Pseudohongiellaceae bacterium]
MSVLRYKALRISIATVGNVLSLLLVPLFALGQQPSFDGQTLNLPAVAVEGQLFAVTLRLDENGEPAEFVLDSAQPLAGASEGATSRFQGDRLSIDSLAFAGQNYRVELLLAGSEPARFQIDGVELIAPAGDGGGVGVCTPPAVDPSHGPNNPPVNNGFSINTARLLDGGPAPDGIPPIGNPRFTQNPQQTDIFPDALVIGVKVGDEVRAYPHTVMDWHEVVNDRFTVSDQPEPYTLSYCPLTGSAMLWKGRMDAADSTFGTSGLLFNSNLVLYDRESSSLWSQMLEQAISGPEVLTIPERAQVVETTWETWSRMYPQTLLMTSETGFSRPYGTYPYGSFRTDQSLIFPVDNSDDRRLHPKERVLGLNVGDASKVYPVSRFGAGVNLISDRVGDMDVVAVGSSDLNFAVVYSSQLSDCSVLEFSPVQDALPIVMTDNEGNQWDVFGQAITGPRSGEQLQKTNSYIAYWFAWTAFFQDAEIHQ